MMDVLEVYENMEKQKKKVKEFSHVSEQIIEGCKVKSKWRKSRIRKFEAAKSYFSLPINSFNQRLIYRIY